MKASSELLGQLHAALAQLMLDELRWYQEQDPPIPLPAADKAAIAKFLKDNAITADPADADELHALRERLKQAAEERQRAKLKQGSEAIKTGTGPVALFPIDEDDF